jgi:hypothetical protein
MKTVTGGGSSTAEWSSGGFNGWRPEKLRFPAIWSMRLAKEGSRRKLGRLSSFGCGGFEIRGAELANRRETVSLLTRRSWRPGKEKERGARRKRE